MLDSVRRIARLAPLCALLATGLASGQMIPLEDERVMSVHVRFMDREDYQEHHPPGPFAYWDDTCTGLAERYDPCPEPPPDSCYVGSCSGGAQQISQFYPAGIQFSGVTGAGWDGPEAGIYLIRAVTSFKFRVDTTFDYNLTMIMDPGDSPGLDGTWAGSTELEVYNSAGVATVLHYLQDGQLQVTGRLGPGTYKLRGGSGKFGPWETFQGPAYFAQWTIQEPPVPTIAHQPSDRSTACGGTVVFSVGTVSPQSSYTFQWRRSFVPLTDGPGVSGATTPTLTLTNVCSADDYDVVVTGPNPAGGTISEPSRLAHLNIISIPTGIEEDPVSEPAMAQVRAASPNPFRVGTALSYTVPPSTHIRARVYDASGTRVRDLTDAIVSGSGSIVWDGRTRTGDRAPAGVYFVHVDAGFVSETKKVVLLK
jgi:hypothetical protein